MGNYCDSICQQQNVQGQHNNDRFKTGDVIFKNSAIREEEPFSALERRNHLEHSSDLADDKSGNEVIDHGPDLSTGTYVDTPELSPDASRTLAALNPMNPPSLIDNQSNTAKPFRLLNRDLTYEGQWRPHGFGKTYFMDGSMFEGQYIEGIPVGDGRYISANGNYYEGEVKAGRANGQGKYISEHFKYTGGFREDKQDGYGIEQRTGQGEYLYEGEFERGNKTQGTLTWQGGKYIGLFQKNLFNNAGSLTLPDGTYTGNFLDGRYQGQGEYIWNDGTTYKGEYQHGVKQGYGRYDSADKLYSYQGNWRAGLRQGGGKSTYKGNQSQGKWQQDHLVQLF